MPTLKRKDGVEFVVQPYRELLSPKKSALLKKEIRLLAHNNGDFVRLFKQSDGQVEAVFSRETGYLLGESVWRYFGRPEDMIYCEALPDNQNAILVIVRSGKVYLDAKLPLDTVRDEFVSLVTGYNYFTIYTYGNVPIADIPEENKFVFEKSFIKSFNELDVPLFESLPVDEGLQLLPIEQAIHAQRLGNGSPAIAIVLFGFLLLLIAIVWIYEGENKFPHHEKHKNGEDPYQLYLSFMSTPDPANQLIAFADSLSKIYDLPGWVAVNATYGGNSTTLEVHSVAGTVGILSDWAVAHDVKLTISAQGVILGIPSFVKEREQNGEIRDLQNTLASVIDDMMLVLPYKSVSLGSIQNHIIFNEQHITLQANNISPAVLKLIAMRIEGLPLELEGCNFTIDHGLLTGQIQLIALGR